VTSEDIKLVKTGDGEKFLAEPGLLRHVLAYNDKLMLVRHTMHKGWVGTLHSHPHEQLVYIISGQIDFTANGKTISARAGDSFIVPGDVAHQASAPEESEVLDVFTPVREDYAAS